MILRQQNSVSSTPSDRVHVPKNQSLQSIHLEQQQKKLEIQNAIAKEKLSFEKELFVQKMAADQKRFELEDERAEKELKNRIDVEKERTRAAMISKMMEKVTSPDELERYMSVFHKYQ